VVFLRDVLVARTLDMEVHFGWQNQGNYAESKTLGTLEKLARQNAIDVETASSTSEPGKDACTCGEICAFLHLYLWHYMPYIYVQLS